MAGGQRVQRHPALSLQVPWPKRQRALVGRARVVVSTGRVELYGLEAPRSVRQGIQLHGARGCIQGLRHTTLRGSDSRKRPQGAQASRLELYGATRVGLGCGEVQRRTRDQGGSRFVSGAEQRRKLDGTIRISTRVRVKLLGYGDLVRPGVGEKGPSPR